MPDLVPVPVTMNLGEGSLVLDTGSTVAGPGSLVAGVVVDALRSGLGLDLPAVDGTATIVLALDDSLGSEGYRLIVDQDGVSLTGGSPAGVFYGVQTLRQLLPPASIGAPGGPVTLPVLTIDDAPAFGWRGSMVDVGRHFLPLPELRRFIDTLALYKLNVLHLHLTEDQGWRFEVKKWPRLTEVGSRRSETVIGHAHHSTEYDGIPHGGFYSQDELRELVAYAADRFVRIVPEIDLPGHTQAARAAYPELGYDGSHQEVMTTFGISDHVMRVDEPGIAFAKDVLTELMDVFDSPFIHIGGDECPKVEWAASEIAQQQKDDLGLPDFDALQSWFTGELATFIEDAGRRLVGWDEILEGGDLPSDVVVMSWRGMEPGIEAANKGLDVVMASTTHTYFDYLQGDQSTEPAGIGGFLPLETVYAYEPVPAELDEAAAGHIIGVQGQLWTEYMPTPQQLFYMAFPRLAALAEVGWTYRDRGEFADFRRRLGTHLERLDALGVNYRPLS